jgi:pSer/pThr/pTyr-binding forkhead associated (FHA) protein
MDVRLEIISGSSAGEKFPLQMTRKILIGRGPNADIAVSADPLLSELHFAFWWDGKSCRIQDLESARGTFLNGRRISEAAVRDGDKIVAGQTHFVVRVKSDLGLPAVAPVVLQGLVFAERDQAPIAESLRPESRTPELQELINLLRTQPQPLFAILDAARDPKVLEVLRNCDQPYQSLYEGVKGEVLAEFAPYLVEVSPKSTLIETLVGEAWGNSWGIFLTSTIGFKETRRHFRHFLLVQTEDGRELYFRFYDPRVLRVFLSTCTPQETSAFFGRIGCYLLEGEKQTELLQFTKTGAGALHRITSVVADREMSVPAGSVPSTS